MERMRLRGWELASLLCCWGGRSCRGVWRGGGATVEGLKKDEDAAVEGVGESEDAAVAGKEGVRWGHPSLLVSWRIDTQLPQCLVWPWVETDSCNSCCSCLSRQPAIPGYLQLLLCNLQLLLLRICVVVQACNNWPRIIKVSQLFIYERRLLMLKDLVYKARKKKGRKEGLLKGKLANQANKWLLRILLNIHGVCVCVMCLRSPSICRMYNQPAAFTLFKGSASQLNKLVWKDSPHIKKFSGTNLFPRSRHQYIYQLSKNPAPRRVSNHSLFATTRC